MANTTGQVMPDGSVQYYEDAMGRAMVSTDYDPTSSYAVGDYCIYDNVRYCCNTDIASGGETWNSAHWDVAKVDDDITEIKSSLSNKTPYINPTQTIIDDTFTSGTAKEITIPQDGYYYLLVINESAGNISATIYNNSDLAVSHIISSSPQVNADWIRVTSNLLPLKAGSKIWCRPFFTKYCYLIKLG